VLFNEEFLERIADDPVASVLEAIDMTKSRLDIESQGWSEKDYGYLLQALALLEELHTAGIFQSPFFPPDISGSSSEDSPAIFGYLGEVERHCETEKGKLQFSAFRTRMATALRNTFSYEFSDGDVSRVQELLNELRELINTSTMFEQTHQRRLLLRLEKLQAEMHKRVGDLDKFWGLLGDAGVALGKFGTDAKPIVDRVREITGIVWRTQARAEELPSDAPQPLLAPPEAVEDSGHGRTA